jgi:hypothetical protein
VLYVAYVDEQPACQVGSTFILIASLLASSAGDVASLSRGDCILLSSPFGAGSHAAWLSLSGTGASPMSRPILAQNGFRLLTYAYAYEWKGSLEQCASIKILF